MDRFSRSARQCPRFGLQPINRVAQTRSYTKETLAKLKKRRKSEKPIHPNEEKPRRPTGRPVEAFGKLREQNSNAAKILRLQESRKIEKALKHEHHGENIYAYVHIRTGQVVYSLTRIMDNTQILNQLVFHGKKTVPPSLRRDSWIPYFSLHFPSSYSGLLAYHHLRELSLQRQLSPPDELVMTITQKASKARKARMTEDEKEEWEDENEGKPYPDGIARLMDRKARAKALMNQKATSVADVAFVVGLMQEEGHLRTPSEVEELVRKRREWRLENAGLRRTRTLKRNWRREEGEGEIYKERAVQAQEGTKWGLGNHAARRIAMEHGGVVVDADVLGRTRVVLLGREGNKEEEKPSEQKKQEQEEHEERSEEEQTTEAETGSAVTADTTTLARTTTPMPITTITPPRDPTAPLAVHIFWSDMRDAAYAAEWPELVSHGELARMAVSRSAGTFRRREVAEMEAGSRAGVGSQGGYVVDRSVHVIGGAKIGEGEEGWRRRGEGEERTVDREEGEGAGGDGDGGGEKGPMQKGEGEVGNSDGGSQGKTKSPEEQVEQLKREGVVFDAPPASSTGSTAGGLLGWVRGRFGSRDKATDTTSP